MPQSRRSRRRRERARTRRPSSARYFSVFTRVLLVAGGVAAIGAGIALLGTGSLANQSRLGRIAGILIVLGIIGILAGAIGRL